jgi:hypothetical protein
MFLEILIVGLIFVVVYLNRCGKTKVHNQKGGGFGGFLVISLIGVATMIGIAIALDSDDDEETTKPKTDTPKTCTCPNGTAAIGAACTGGVKCVKCGPGYTMVVPRSASWKILNPLGTGVCEVTKKCTCPNGTAATGAECSAARTADSDQVTQDLLKTRQDEKCVSCNPGYTMHTINASALAVGEAPWNVCNPVAPDTFAAGGGKGSGSSFSFPATYTISKAKNTILNPAGKVKPLDQGLSVNGVYSKQATLCNGAPIYKNDSDAKLYMASDQMWVVNFGTPCTLGGIYWTGGNPWGTPASCKIPLCDPVSCNSNAHCAWYDGHGPTTLSIK